MQMLSYKDIENIANETLQSYLGADMKKFKPVDIKGLLTEHLKLNVEYRTLSKDGSVLGLTTFDDVAIELWDDNESDLEFIEKGTVLIDRSLLPEKMTGRRNFTISHEGAHQILDRLYPEVENRYGNETKVRALRQLQTNADWQEWQADSLASALLMPEELIKYSLSVFCDTSYIDELHPIKKKDIYKQFSVMSDFLKVSKTALAIRMQRLNLLGGFNLDKPYAFMNIVKEA